MSTVLHHRYTKKRNDSPNVLKLLGKFSRAVHRSSPLSLWNLPASRCFHSRSSIHKASLTVIEQHAQLIDSIDPRSAASEQLHHVYTSRYTTGTLAFSTEEVVPGVSKRDGKYRGFVRLKGFHSESKTFDTRKEALAWSAARERELQRRRLSCPDLLIDEVVDQYLKHVEPKRRMADSHAKHDVPSFRRRLNGLTLSGLFGTGLSDWVIAQGDVAPGTRNWHVCRLYGVLRQAEMHLKIHVPWSDMDACRRKLQEMGLISAAGRRDRRVSDAEIDAIKRNLCRQVSVRMADIIDFALQSCMRVGEICRLQWNDLNEIDRTVLIRDRKHPTRKFGNHQVVPLLRGSLDTLLRQPVRGDRPFPHDPTNISLKFRRAADDADIPDVVFHDLRHEGISRMFEMGFAIQEVALVSGHTNWKTLARYVHLRPQSLVAREAQLLEKESPRRRPEGERLGASGGSQPQGLQTPYPTPMVADRVVTR